ncbi:hypothetical protein IJ670_06665 [bacterium]|nr:hypothetical protein [bacterium]
MTKKLIALFGIILLTATLTVEARTIYDSTGRHIIKDGTIRGQKRARALQMQQQGAAAAAKLEIPETTESDTIKEVIDVENQKQPLLKSNYYQDTHK